MNNEINYQLEKLSILQRIRNNLNVPIPILLGKDAINLVDAYIMDVERIIKNYDLEENVQ